MEKYSRQHLQNIYISLPQELKEAIFSVDNAEKIYQIAQRYQVLPEKIPHLARMVGHVLSGVLKIEKFIDGSIQKNLNIDRNTAEKIARDIKEEIFQPVMNVLIKIQQESSHEFSRPSTPRPLITPKPKNKNIVDLKNR